MRLLFTNWILFLLSNHQHQSMESPCVFWNVHAFGHFFDQHISMTSAAEIQSLPPSVRRKQHVRPAVPPRRDLIWSIYCKHEGARDSVALQKAYKKVRKRATVSRQKIFHDDAFGPRVCGSLPAGHHRCTSLGQWL